MAMEEEIIYLRESVLEKEDKLKEIAQESEAEKEGKPSS